MSAVIRATITSVTIRRNVSSDLVKRAVLEIDPQQDISVLHQFLDAPLKITIELE